MKNLIEKLKHYNMQAILSHRRNEKQRIAYYLNRINNTIEEIEKLKNN